MIWGLMFVFKPPRQRSIHGHQISLSDWNSYFDLSNDSALINYEGNEDHNFTSPSRVHVLNCRFSSNDKGIIKFESSSDESKLLVEYCVFKGCTSDSNGGAINFGKKGQCVLAYNCIVRCKTSKNYHGQFSYVEVTNNKEAKNFIISSSFMISDSNTVEDTMYHKSGKLKCSGINISDNIIRKTAAIFIYQTEESVFLFSSVRNNTASDSIVVRCNGVHLNLSYSNIIENKQEGSGQGIIFTESGASISMYHCSIFDNCQNKKGNVFYDSGQGIICYDCAIPLDQKVFQNDVDFIDEPKSLFINYYAFINLDECKAAPESWGSITPDLPQQTIGTPEPSTNIPSWLKESVKRRRQQNNINIGKIQKIVANIHQPDFISSVLETKHDQIIDNPIFLVILASLTSFVHK